LEGPFHQIELSDPALRVIETLRWDGTALVRIDRHSSRARASCAALGFRFDADVLGRALATIAGTAALRVRVALCHDGRVEVTTAPLPPTPQEWRVAVSPQRLDSTDPWLRHKTTRRKRYDDSRATLPPGVDEVLFRNECGNFCEGTITNLFFDIGKGLRTPPVTCGLLPGVLRAELLEHGLCHEEILQQAELTRAKLWVGNSLRGLIPARLVLETKQAVPHKQD
jgi:4-amino-4-deoxychorismate lyase